MLGLTLLGELIVNRLPLIGGNLENFPFVLEQHHRRDWRRGAVAGSIDSGDYRWSRGIRHSHFIFEEIIAGHLLGISAEQDVRATAGHVGGYRYRAFASGLGHDARFTLVLLGVQNLVRNFCGFQESGNRFGLFNGDCTNEYRLPAFVIMANAVREGIVFLHDAVYHGGEFFLFRAVNDVGMLFANQIAISRNDHDIEVINLAEFRSFRFRSTGHARQFLVHAEIILKGDGGEGLIFALDFHAFLGFHGLVQPV